MAQRQMKEKQHYEELSDKQKAIVDAYAEKPNAGDKELAEIASEKLGDRTVSRSYVKPVLETYPDIANDRKLQLENQRTNGEDQTVFEPFKQRPGTLEIELSKSDIRELLNGEIPDGLRKELIERLVERA